MAWKIVSINNETHAVTVSQQGDRHSFIIPEEHRHSRELKQAYIASVTDAHDAAAAKAAADALIPVKVKRPWLLFLVIAAEALAIALLLMRK